MRPVRVVLKAGSLPGGVASTIELDALFGGAGGEEATEAKTGSTVEGSMVDEGAAFATTGG